MLSTSSQAVSVFLELGVVGDGFTQVSFFLCLAGHEGRVLQAAEAAQAGLAAVLDAEQVFLGSGRFSTLRSL